MADTVQFKNSIFRVTSSGSDNVVVSPVFLPELKKLPDDVLSLSQAVAEVPSSTASIVL